MNKALLAGTAFLGTGLIASPTLAADGIKLGAGGFFRETYTLSEGELGPDVEALANLCIVPPGSTTNFSAFSPDQWGADTLTSNGVCSGVDDRGDAQKLVYITPDFGSFQLTLFYTPNGGYERYTDDTGPHVGMPFNTESPQNIFAYGAYSYEGDGWGVTAGGGASLESQVESTVGPDRDEQDFYQAGVSVTLGNFAIGGVFEYYNNFLDEDATNLDRWIAGIGAGYTIDAFSIGVQYSHLDQDGKGSSTDEFQQDRVVLTGNYAMGPGINLDGALGYSWIDADPDESPASGTEADGHDAFEIGIGTNFQF